MNITCYFDGACEPKNPGGNMGLGAAIFFDGVEFQTYSLFVDAHPANSNNVAEYGALQWVLNTLIELGLNDKPITIYGDSMLVVMQMSGKWKMKNGLYLQYAKECKQLVNMFFNLSIKWVPREQNCFADDLSKSEIKKPA